MVKIPTIFDRDWDGNRGVIDKRVVELPEGAQATEKLDGTNVRLTVRSGRVVRIEKRRNPSKRQKKQGITDPWYVDASEYEPGDQHIVEAARNTEISNIGDGEWSGEAVGPKIQGNPLGLVEHTVVLFSHSYVREYLRFPKEPPIDFDELQAWMQKQTSRLNDKAGIEGIVWWYQGRPIGKIKLQDYK